MRNFALVLTLAALPLPAIARPAPVSAVLGENASGFKNLGDCEQTLDGPSRHSAKKIGNKRGTRRGSMFNRAAGNMSRCEMIEGEPLIVVIPRGA
jgi:hypothetical protein